MPIRFRCAECNQLLGIARRKSGSIISCPTCAYEQIVPDPDEPSHLGGQVHAESLLEKSDFEEILGQPLERGSRRAGAAAPTALGIIEPREADARPILNGPHIHQQSGSGLPAPSSQRIDLSRLTGDRNKLVYLSPISPFWIGTMVAVVLAFLLGIVVGRALQTDNRPLVKSKKEDADANAQPKNPLPAVEEKKDGPALGAEPQRPKFKFGIYGRVLYREANQRELKPDAGATVIAFPRGREMNPRFVIDGLRPGHEAQGKSMGMKQIRDNGGEVTFVKGDGTFALQLNNPGNYCMLVLSAHAARPNGLAMENWETNFFEKYFRTPKAEIIESLEFRVIDDRNVFEDGGDAIKIEFGS